MRKAKNRSQRLLPDAKAFLQALLPPDLKPSLALLLVLTLSSGIISSRPVLGKPCIHCDHKKSGDSPELLPRPESGSKSESMENNGASPTSEMNSESQGLWGSAEATMLKTGTEATTLQTGTESTLLRTGADSTLIQANVEKQALPLNILILIDASQSMKEGLGGMLSSDHEEKMTAAKHVLENTLQTIPNDVNVGLRVFGQSFRNDPYIDCQQSALLVPIGRGNRRSIIEAVRQIRPFGLTPLTYALMQAERDLQDLDGIKHVILISDGAETCGGDPCAYIQRLTDMGIKMKIDIVGLGLKRDRDAKDQLNCIAGASGGKFYDANSSAELIESIRNTVRQAVGESKVSGKVITKLKQPVLDQLPADLKP